MVMNELLRTSNAILSIPRMECEIPGPHPFLDLDDRFSLTDLCSYRRSTMQITFSDKLPRRRVYIRRQLRFLLAALAFIMVSLAIGVSGYMGIAHLAFTDAFLNASMILGGMGPVDTLPDSASKWFASFYALYSGVALLSIVATMLAPTIHRLLHKLHLDQNRKA